MHYKSYSDLSQDIRSKLPLLIKEDFDLVVGIPRSGMIPAFMIAFNLNLNCITVESLINNDIVKHGITRIPNKKVNHAWDAKKILLVDDSIKSGESLAKVMEKMPDQLKSKITTLAIYTGLSGSKKVDMYIEYLPWPRLFEWNLLYHTALPYYCFGIDGILCKEVLKSDYNEEAYKHEILNAAPLIIPNTKIHSLVTNRLEKFRNETETWLSKHNVQYDHLIMLNQKWGVASNFPEAGLKHKAKYYKKSDTILFVENDPYQAHKIAKLTLKPVFCFTDNKMYMPDSLDFLKKDPLFLPKELKRLLKRFIQIFGNRGEVDIAAINTEPKLK